MKLHGHIFEIVEIYVYTYIANFFLKVKQVAKIMRILILLRFLLFGNFWVLPRILAWKFIPCLAVRPFVV